MYMQFMMHMNPMHKEQSGKLSIGDDGNANIVIAYHYYGWSVLTVERESLFLWKAHTLLAPLHPSRFAAHTQGGSRVLPLHAS
jgi:hypothetical protein